MQTAWDIRKVVFVVEQECPEELEWEFEEESTHYLAFLNGKAVGTARWRVTEKGIKLERFAVLKEARGKGVGSSLVKYLLEELLGQTEKKDSLVWDGSKYVPFSSIPVDTILFDFDKDLSLQIQPIDSILKYALLYSPTLKFEDAAIQKSMYNLKYILQCWFYNPSRSRNFSLLKSSRFS
jgi:GNAT superfamily N-acetyltransferase